MIRRMQNSEGISLLEVIVALALISTIMVTGFQFTVTTMRSMQRHGDAVRQVMVARSIAAWWERLSEEERLAFSSDRFMAVPDAVGLIYTESIQWRLVTRTVQTGLAQLMIEVKGIGVTPGFVPVSGRADQ